MGQRGWDVTPVTRLYQAVTSLPSQLTPSDGASAISEVSVWPDTDDELWPAASNEPRPLKRPNPTNHLVSLEADPSLGVFRYDPSPG